jgi:hypothetical protein
VRVKRGLTLSELLLAAAILAFVLTGLLALFINCIFINEANRNLSSATGHAQFVMEEIKNTDFNSIESKINNGDWDWTDSQTIESKGLAPLNNESIDTQEVGGDTELLDVRVTVNWQDRRRRNRSLTLETLIAEP